MKLVRLSLVLVCVLGLAALGVSAAGAKPQNSAFTPKAGKYTGTAKAQGKTRQATAEVVKYAGKTLIGLTIPAAFACSDGTSLTTGILFSAEVKKNTFSSRVTSAGIAYEVDGKFTSATGVSGTASKKGPKTDREMNPPTCSTGKISFSLKKGK